jgi:hypothetical protein
MSWLRQAGGFWINPQDPQRAIPVDSHAPYAWDALTAIVMPKEEEAALVNQYISEAEQVEQTVVESPGGEQKVDYKGTGGAEAKEQALQKVADEKAKRVRDQYNATNPMGAAMALQGMGWVRISTDDPAMVMVMAADEASVLAAQDVITAEAMKRDMLTLFIGSEPQMSIIPQSINPDLATAIANARAKGRRPVAPTSTSSALDTAGLGPWRVAGAATEVSYDAQSPTVSFSPLKAQGKQWCVLSPQGRLLAEGPSRKWAERSARKADWQRRRKA